MNTVKIMVFVSHSTYQCV